MDGSNHTAWVFDFDDMGALEAVASSLPLEVAAKAESHGVIMPMTVCVEPENGYQASEATAAI